MASLIVRLAAVLVAGLVALSAVQHATSRALEREVDRVALRVVSAEASAASEPAADVANAGELRVRLVVEASGSAALARLARGVELDVAVQGMPLGRVAALPHEGGPVEGPARFYVDAATSGASADALRAVRDRALAENGGGFAVHASGTLHLPLGVEAPVAVNCVARALASPSVEDGAVAFRPHEAEGGGALEPAALPPGECPNATH